MPPPLMLGRCRWAISVFLQASHWSICIYAQRLYCLLFIETNWKLANQRLEYAAVQQINSSGSWSRKVIILLLFHNYVYISFFFTLLTMHQNPCSFFFKCRLCVFFAGWTTQIIHHFLKWVCDFLSVRWLFQLQIGFVLFWWAHKLSQIKKKN